MDLKLKLGKQFEIEIHLEPSLLALFAAMTWLRSILLTIGVIH
ncbi:MAG TPA: hypothetical protein VF429_00565 [Anaerolineae bacterium]